LADVQDAEEGQGGLERSLEGKESMIVDPRTKTVSIGLAVADDGDWMVCADVDAAVELLRDCRPDGKPQLGVVRCYSVPITFPIPEAAEILSLEPHKERIANLEDIGDEIRDLTQNGTEHLDELIRQARYELEYLERLKAFSVDENRRMNEAVTPSTSIAVRSQEPINDETGTTVTVTETATASRSVEVKKNRKCNYSPAPKIPLALQRTVRERERLDRQAEDQREAIAVDSNLEVYPPKGGDHPWRNSAPRVINQGKIDCDEEPPLLKAASAEELESRVVDRLAEEIREYLYNHENGVTIFDIIRAIGAERKHVASALHEMPDVLQESGMWRLTTLPAEVSQ
jgi:hypothetical protein